MLSFNHSKEFFKITFIIGSTILFSACQSTSPQEKSTFFANNMSDYQLMNFLHNRPPTSDLQLMQSLKAEREKNVEHYVLIKGEQTVDNHSLTKRQNMLDDSNSVLIVPR
jgi:hypothetical protein